MKFFKKTTNFCLILMCTFLFIGCPSDDESDNLLNSSEEKKFVGAWDMSDNSFLIFSEDRQVLYGYSNNKQMGMWSYNKDTKVLSTTLVSASESMQWMITLLYDSEWSGVKLWDGKKGTSSANRIFGQVDDQKRFVDLLLLNRVWYDKDKEKESSFYYGTNGNGYLYFDDAKFFGLNSLEWTNDKIIIYYTYRKGSIEIFYPYNFSKTYIILTYWNDRKEYKKTCYLKK